MPLPPGPPPKDSALAIAAWNVLGGLDWAGLPIVVEMMGISDVEQLILDLVTIRAFQSPQADD